MKRKILTTIIFLIGLGILLYPVISKIVSLSNQTVALSKYIEDVENLDDEQIQGLKNETKYFNENLFSSSSFNASLENKKSSIDFLDKDNPIAYISIPKININLPIYEGTTNKVLEQGIGHISQTSIPCGGINTHSVLVGHTGLTKGIFFDNIDKLVTGDKFFITYLNETLEYKVTEIRKILPDETENLQIEKDNDKVTLVTCTPKHINTHRLLVTGTRIKLENQEQKELNKEITGKVNKIKAIISTIFTVCFIILIIIILILFIILIYKIIIKQNNKK